MQGRLFLEETLPKNIATSIKDARFLDFFFARLKHVSDAHRAYMTAHDIPVADYPFVSVCGKELNFVRPAATPIVFHSLVDNNKNNGHDGHRLDLVFGGNTLLQPFDELQGIAISERTGRLYHKLTTHSLFPSGSSSSTNRSYDEYGLIRSAVAVTLSARIVVVLDGTDINPTNLQHSGIGFQTAANNNGSIVPIPWLPSDAELGLWAMPFTGDE